MQETHNKSAGSAGRLPYDLICVDPHHSISFMTVQNPIPFSVSTRAPEQVAFDRHELGVILSLYGRMVAAGEWRDYAIACLHDRAVFSIFRRTSENPLYRVEKNPRLREKQGLYLVRGMEGQILRRGHDLRAVLGDLERKLIRAVK